MQVGLRRSTTHRDGAANVAAWPPSPSIRPTSGQHCSRSGAPSSLAVQSIHSILGHATALAAAASGERIYVLMVIKYLGDIKLLWYTVVLLFIATSVRHVVYMNIDRQTQNDFFRKYTIKFNKRQFDIRVSMPWDSVKELQILCGRFDLKHDIFVIWM